ncbi:MAG TPA: T9SS type A sorting domain-containing protein [Prolixibacteraceae bacterium]|nr:T9SS type A sorting domain-containing protein [Prolixibacteraceae bacterium]
MKIYTKNLLVFALSFFFFYSQAQQVAEEIIFHSNGSEFAPVIVLQGEAEVLWTWDDNTTTNSNTPVKNYGSAQLRRNTLKVTPWSAVQRINIGYDAQDGGSPEIELVENQFVSQVENLNLVAPYLKEWCSSYNMITSLDFSNFVNLETIECFLSQSLQSVNLTNTPKLKRACFVVNGLQNLNLSESNTLEQILAPSNTFTNVTLPLQTNNIWSLVFRDNPQLTNRNLFNDLTNYPNISNLAIWEANQTGELVIPKTNPSRWVGIRAYGNEYTSLDLRGSLQNPLEAGLVDMHDNKLTTVEIAGCHQIKTIDLSQNLLSAEAVDYVLKQLDEFGPTITPRTVNLSNNQAPTAQGKIYQTNLEAKEWTVIVDFPSAVENLSGIESFNVYPNPSNGKFFIQLGKMPAGGATVEIRNVVGQKLLEQNINDIKSEWSVNQYSGKIFFVTLKGKNILTTKRIIVD